ncbi:MAG: flagellar type III secretion system pore protein FliP [Defluviitaleaceae bacterium]|nr:flagellar type III secretion system pore protein FliP [Defluviitaleaceae bacterium]
MVKKIISLAAVFIVALTIFPKTAYAGAPVPWIDMGITIGGANDPAVIVPALHILFLVSIIALAPSILMLLTGFTRIVIAMHFVRAAMATQQMPPNQVLVGVALILTLFLMAPALTEINDNALQPLGRSEISIEEAIERGMEPLRKFMRDQVEDRDVNLFFQLSRMEAVATIEEIPDSILIPAFVLGELTKGFMIGFLMYLPFIVIDMVVASVLMAMGMMMLPPAMISMPFKLMIFLLAGGWSFLLEYVLRTFRVT